MASLNFKNATQEIVLALRNNDVISDTVRGVTETTEAISPINGQTVINLANSTVRNIEVFTVDAIAQIYLTDYTVNFSTGVVTMTSGFSGGESVTITYDHGGDEKIYPDFPRDDLKLSSYPRVGLAQTSGSTEAFDLGAGSDISDYIITIFCIVHANKDAAFAGGLGGTDDLKDMVQAVRDTIINNRKSFTSFPYIRPLGGPNPITYGQDKKLIMQSQDFIIRFVVE